MPSSTIADEIERYLRTGDTDDLADAWPGDLMDRGRKQHADLRAALLDEVRRLAKGLNHEPIPADVGAAVTRAKIEPMVRGLCVRAPRPQGGPGAARGARLLVVAAHARGRARHGLISGGRDDHRITRSRTRRARS